MRKIKWNLDIGFGRSCSREGEFLVDDNATDEEIEEAAKEEAFNCIDWGWEEVQDET